MAEGQAPDGAPARRKAAPAGERRRRRLSRRPWSRPRPVPKALRGRLDRRPRQSGPGRPSRRREKLAGLRHRPKSLPRQSIPPLSSLAKTLPGHGSPHSRRLRPRTPRRRRARHDLLEILEERHGRRSTIVTSQLPLAAWHEIIGDPTYADAILDRLVHNAHRIELTGESLRRTRGRQLKTA
jgi:IstB-like ATP binding protein